MKRLMEILIVLHGIATSNLKWPRVSIAVTWIFKKHYTEVKVQVMMVVV
jgi:hypothetical protein